MKRTILIIVAITLAASSSSFAKKFRYDGPEPKFEDHSVAVSEISQRVETDLKSDPYAEMYKKPILKAAKRSRPNFAGHYMFAKWECGANCMMFGIVDGLTGKVFVPPFSISDWAQGPFDFRDDSKLLVVNGVINQTGPTTTFYYLWDDGKLKLIQSNIK